MSNHQKRLSVPNSWPVERKTETFTVAAGAGPHGNEGVPLLVVLRDVLGYVDSKKEARYALRQGSIRINGEQASDEHRPIGMFDILAFAERDEHYRVFPDEGGRLALTPIEADAAGSKLGKVVGKQQVGGGETQLTLHDGETLLVDDDYAVNDSIVVANEGSDIVAHFPYEEGALVTAVQGGHAGEIGRVEEIQVTPGSGSNNVIVSQEDGDSGTAEPSRNEGGEAAAGFETVEEYVVVIDENFVEGAEETEAEAEAEEAAETEEEADAEEADADAEDEVEAEDEGGDDE